MFGLTTALDIFLKLFVLLALIFYVLPTLIALFFNTFSGKIEDIFIKKYNAKAESIVSAPGIIIHELSHYIMAKIFRYNIVSVKLFQLPTIENKNIRGYVEYTYDSSSMIQKAGSVLISIAPAITIPLINIEMIYFTYLNKGKSDFILLLLITIIVFILTVNGIHLSPQDWFEFRKGSFSYLLILLLIALMLVILLVITKNITGYDILSKIPIDHLKDYFDWNWY